MRQHGPVTSADRLGHDGHVCWGFDSDESFDRAALEFLTDGLRLGQRLAHVAAEPVEAQRERLAPLEGIHRLLDTGALQLFTHTELYDVTRPIEPAAQLAVFGGATDQALADGYAGLRVAAKVTELVADPEKHAAHVRWESVADAYMASRPLAALCAYDCRALPEDLMGDLAAVHPACHGPRGVPSFRAFSFADSLVLDGEVDAFSAAHLDRILAVALRPETQALDLSHLDFLDHRGLEALVAHVRRRRSEGGGFAVRNTPPTVRRLSELLELDLVA